MRCLDIILVFIQAQSENPRKTKEAMVPPDFYRINMKKDLRTYAVLKTICYTCFGLHQYNLAPLTPYSYVMCLLKDGIIYKVTFIPEAELV